MTAMQWTVFALLLIIALLLLAHRRKLRRMRADLARARTVRR